MARKKAPEVTDRGTVEVEHDGRLCRGSYEVAADRLTVWHGEGEKAGELRGMPAQTLARILLIELVRDEEALRGHGRKARQG